MLISDFGCFYSIFGAKVYTLELFSGIKRSFEMKKIVVILAILSLVSTTTCENPADNPIYSIAITGVADNNHTFPGATVGYGTQNPLPVIVSNTGNQATGTLNVILSGTNASSFTLSISSPSLPSIATGSNTTFTIRPNTGLDVGTYTATCTVAGGNNLTASFAVSFTVSSYGVSLSQSDNYTFLATDLGYGIQEPLSVVVSNIGTQATGTLSIALSGTNANSFSLSTTSINSITTNGNATFSVRPNTGLTSGTYTATVTVSGGNGISAQFNVNFTVNTYGISLSQTAEHTFSSTIFGYSEQTPLSITVNNIGNQATGTLNVKLSGTNSNSFMVSTTTIDSIIAGGSASDAFSVRPNTGLAGGTYIAIVTVSDGNNISAQFNVSFTVNAIVPSVPQNFLSIPSINQIVLSWTAPESNGGSTILRYEVSSGYGSTWVTATSNTSHTFIGLETGTSYTFYVRAVNIVGNGAQATLTEITGLTPDYSWYGDGFANNFNISTMAQLVGLARIVNGETSSSGPAQSNFNGKTIILLANITLTGNWTPIGFYDDWNRIGKPFTGVFDGNNRTITGLTINRSNGICQALFGYIETGSEIKNLRLENVDINGSAATGGVVGWNNGGTVINCFVTGSLYSQSSWWSGGTIGGVAGENSASGTIENCSFNGTVSGNGSPTVGGIAGWSGGVVKNCFVIGSVSGFYTPDGGEIDIQASIGGVVGRNIGSVENCYNTGDVKAIAGTDLYKSSGTSGGFSVGGVVGQNSGTVTSSYNYSSVTGSGPNSGNRSFSYRVGGVVGVNGTGGWGGTYTSTVINCYNTGNVESIGYYTGGIAGYNYAWTSQNGIQIARLENCISLGLSVLGVGDAWGSGRVVGYNDGGTLSTNKARSNMNVNGEIITTGIETNSNGTDITLGIALLSLFSGWNTSVWNIPNGTLTVGGTLPTLRNMPENSSQNPRLP